MPGHRYSIFRNHAWRWIVRESDPPEFVFPSGSPFDGWSLFNPLVPPPEGFVPGTVDGHPATYPIGDGRCLVEHLRLDFRAPVDDLDVALRDTEKVLRWLRFASGQASAATDVAGHQKYPDVPAGPFPPAPFAAPPAFVPRSNIVASALSFERLEAVSTADPSMSVPIYADLLLDAIEADGDDRKMILYSAIAVEVMAATRLDEMHEAVQRSHPSELRLVSLAQAGGATITKDPVYERLRKGAKIRTLLHELPLYVSRRSVMVEDEPLYQELITLYETRNQLVHFGDAESASLLTIDYQGAKRALKAAVSVYKWFAAAGRYVTPHGFAWSAG